MKKLAVFGAGLATLSLLKELERQNTNVEITLVDPKDYVEIPFSMLRSLIDNDTLGKKSRQKINEVFPHVTHIQSKLKTLKADSAILEDSQELFFDYAVVATGSRYKGFNTLRANYQDTLQKRTVQWGEQSDAIKNAQKIIVVGGGVIGVELAGEILAAYPNKELTIISGSDRFLADKEKNVGKKALKILKKLSNNTIKTVFGDRAVYQEGMESGQQQEILTESGATHSADLIFFAMGNEFHTEYMKEQFSQVLDAKNRVKVNNHLLVEGTDNIFALGDVSNRSIAMGHIAMDQGMFTASNIQHLLQNNSLQEFEIKSKEKIFFITVGRKRGLVKLPFGRLDFMISLKQKNDFFVEKLLANGKVG